MTVKRQRFHPRRPGALQQDLECWAGQVSPRFQALLSLDPLIAFWRRAVAAAETQGFKALHAQIEGLLEVHPEFTGPIEDPAVLETVPELLDLLMLPVFPPAFRDRDLTAALVPFSSQVVYATPSFRRVLTRNQETMRGTINLEENAFRASKAIGAYLHILRTVYDVEIVFDYPFIFTVADPQTGLDRHFTITSDPRFLTVEPVDEVPDLSKDEIRHLMMELADPERWQRLLPPEGFAFFGFDIVQAADVTEREVISMLKYDLLVGDEGHGRSAFGKLPDRLRTLLRQPDLHLALYGVEDQALHLLHQTTDSDPLADGTEHATLQSLKGSLFGNVLHDRSMHVVPDLQVQADGAAVERRLKQVGAGSMVTAPLVVHGKLIGLFIVWAETPGALNNLTAMPLIEVLPLLATAVKRGQETLQSRVQSVILSQYTAIHPCVEWRFRQAAREYLQRLERGEPAYVEPIVFRDVYPLFAASDIRSSSEYRNEAVREDLVDQLELAERAMVCIQQTKPLPILDFLLARIDRYRETLEEGLDSGDEARVRDFLNSEIEPLFEQFDDLAPAVRQGIAAYQDALNAQRGFLYRSCKAYDDSIQQINQTITAYLDAEERKAQAIFPHYFERHQSDGVEFSIYTGASLLPNGGFHPIFVRNLRFWQLRVMCGIARRVEALKASMEVPMEVTHHILSQRIPISIRFRFDETRFDVDGAHHVRFEIIKQRVVKATIKNTGERLTQPGKIAIVYEQDRDAIEYEEFMAYLRQTGYLTDEVEHLDLDDLQGISGLQALRVTVAPIGEDEVELAFEEHLAALDA